jgi:Rod binding domain-containing protein
MSMTIAAGAPSTTELAQPGAAAAWKSAQAFEAMALGQLLAPMFQTVDLAHDAFGGGDGEDAFRPMLTQEIARQMAAHGGLGLAVPVFHQILRLQEQRTESPS